MFLGRPSRVVRNKVSPGPGDRVEPPGARVITLRHPETRILPHTIGTMSHCPAILVPVTVGMDRRMWLRTYLQGQSKVRLHLSTNNRTLVSQQPQKGLLPVPLPNQCQSQHSHTVKASSLNRTWVTRRAMYRAADIRLISQHLGRTNQSLFLHNSQFPSLKLWCQAREPSRRYHRSRSRQSTARCLHQSALLIISTLALLSIQTQVL